MLVCKKSSNRDGISKQAVSRIQRGVGRRKLGEGGPVFLTQRKPSAFAEQLLAQVDHAGAYNEPWFAGRQSTRGQAVLITE